MTVADEILDSSDPERRGPSRRTMLKAAAWSVPVIVVAQAAPALAQAGPSQPVTINFGTSKSCKYPGQSFNDSDYCITKGYAFFARFTNALTVPVSIAINSMFKDSDNQCIFGVTLPSACSTKITSVTLPAGSAGSPSVTVVAIHSSGDADSGSAELTVNFTYTPQGGTPTPASVSGPENGATWQGSCNFENGWNCATTGPPTNCSSPGSAGKVPICA